MALLLMPERLLSIEDDRARAFDEGVDGFCGRMSEPDEAVGWTAVWPRERLLDEGPTPPAIIYAEDA